MEWTGFRIDKKRRIRVSAYQLVDIRVPEYQVNEPERLKRLNIPERQKSSFEGVIV
jgi:hypothetical protein